jgi:uncharacterized membrane protein
MDLRQWMDRRLWVDQRIEVIIGNLLRAGVLLSAGVVLIGGCVYLSRHAFEHADYRVFTGEPSEFRTVPGIMHAVMIGRGRAFIQLGLLLLIATPIARVVFSIAGFAIEGDHLYVLFAALVLIILLASFFSSGLGG